MSTQSDRIVPDPAPAGGMSEFSSRSLKLERRPPGDGTPAHFRLVWEECRGKDRKVTKTEWVPRHSIYAHVARAWSRMRAFVFEGMGRVPSG